VILLLRHDATDGAIADLRQRLDGLGFECSRLDGARGRALQAQGSDVRKLLPLRDHPAVEDLLSNQVTLGSDEPLWPHGSLQLLILLVVIGAVLLVLVAVAPAGLGDAADPGAGAPAGGSEWYMRPLAAFLRLFPAPLGGILVLVLWIGLIAWPFLDRQRAVDARSRRVSLLVRVMGALLILAMIALALGPVS
jgi:cytochrome b6-f complex subunit 4